MIKFVIDDEQLERVISRDIVTLREVRSHELNIELKKERELVFDKIMYLLSDLDLPCNMNPYDVVACIRSEIHQIQVGMG